MQINLALDGQYSRDQSFLDVAPHLFTSHHYHQLGGQLNQTATRVTLKVDRLREWRNGKETNIITGSS